MKTCTQCGEKKPATTEYFYSTKMNKEGLKACCKECEKARARAYKAEHKEHYHELYKKYYKQDRERYLENSRRWKAENPDKHKEHVVNFRNSESGKQKLKQYRDRYRQNKDVEITTEQWRMCLTYFNHSCAYCGITEEESKAKYDESLHREHLINDGRNDIKNLVPSCKSCNSEKNTRSFNDWYNEDNQKYDRNRYLRIYYWIRFFSKAIV